MSALLLPTQTDEIACHHDDCSTRLLLEPALEQFRREALHHAPARFPRAVVQGGFARRHIAPAELLLARFARYWPGTMAQLPGFAQIQRAAQGRPFAQREPAVWDYFLRNSGNFPIAAVA